MDIRVLPALLSAGLAAVAFHAPAARADFQPAFVAGDTVDFVVPLAADPWSSSSPPADAELLFGGKIETTSVGFWTCAVPQSGDYPAQEASAFVGSISAIPVRRLSGVMPIFPPGPDVPAPVPNGTRLVNLAILGRCIDAIDGTLFDHYRGTVK